MRSGPTACIHGVHGPLGQARTILSRRDPGRGKWQRMNAHYGGRPVTDSRMKSGVNARTGGTSPDNGPPAQTPAPSDKDAQRQALQVLMLAQRTAEEHVASAQQEADKIWASARATAEQIARDARAHSDNARREASKALADARATAEQIVRDARTHADGARREADRFLSDARTQAEEIGRKARANADELEQDAQQRYKEAVGGLTAKRAGLQEQIEALRQFDRDYRARLRTFMQNQLLALGVDEPPAVAEAEDPASATDTDPPPDEE